MSREGKWNELHKQSRFPPVLFVVYLGVLLLMSGIHTGIIVGMNQAGWSDLAKTVTPILYWGAVAVGLTLFTREQVRKTYEEPMQQFAKATRV